MLAKVQIFALISALVLGGSAATMAMTQDDIIFNPFRKDPDKVTIFRVSLEEVEALYDHEVYVTITSENRKPIWGTLVLIPPKHEFEECPEWEEDKDHCHHEEENECCHDEDEKEERERHEEEERREKEEEKEEREGHDEEIEDKEEEEHHEKEGKEEREGQEEEQRKKEEEDWGCEPKREKQYRKPDPFKFNFKEGKGRLLLFKSSHKFLGFTAEITVFSKEKAKVVPFIFVKDTKVFIYPDTMDDDGNRYCEIEELKEGARYGFEDQFESVEFECDWDYDDVVLNHMVFYKDHNHKEDVRVFRLKVRWGQLDGFNSEHEKMIPWDGSVFVGCGRVELIRPLFFERDGKYEHGGDDLIFKKNSKSEIQFRSSTTVHWDGIVVRIIVPENRPQTHVAIHTAQWSGVFDVEILGSLHERFFINDLGDEIEINGFEVEKERFWERHELEEENEPEHDEDGESLH
ncbi:MAG: hypothetical protein JSV56_03540 [Methanomassiliicoccales archaeon]|nr:MAG: hypothetical protein JSV56_03540 [Methanomassiliicoccales archaeon]